MEEEDLIPVVNLPDPEPAVAAPRKNGGLVIPTVPDDIVREICALLEFNDRLALSLTSRHMHDVVRPRVEEVFVQEPQLYAFHSRVFEQIVRASQLRVLHVDAPADIIYPTAARYFVDIISRTTELNTLRCSRLLSEALRSRHLRTFTNLRHIQLCGCTPTMLRALRLPATLVEVHLSNPPHGTKFTFRRILRSIAHLQSLATLVLEGFAFTDRDGEEVADEDDEAAEEHDEGEADRAKVSCASQPTLSSRSVHTLQLFDAELPPSVDWLTTFPALRTVLLDSCIHFDADARPTQPLQHLIVATSFEGDQVPWQVNRLTCLFDTTAAEDLVLDEPCDNASLLAVTLRPSLIAYSFWEEVFCDPLAIRLLEIECIETALAEIIHLFWEFLRSHSPVEDVRFLCLSIVAPASPEQTPEDILECRNEILDHAFKYLPSLRYVALAEPPGDRYGNLPYEDDYAGTGAPWRWWRIVRDPNGSPVEIREIPAWEGERVRSYLRNADKDAAEHFEDKFVALR